MACVCIIFSSVICDQEVRGATFENYEIRVIRPRFFTKKGKFELGATISAVTNQTFIYTYLGSIAATYHVTDSFGLELSGTYGISVDKDDKRILDTADFLIKTQILRTQYMMEAVALYAPIYGKYQLSTGRLIYFDTFVAAGVGTTGVDFKYDHCPGPADTPAGKTPYVVPDRRTQAYPTLVGGLGQRFFLNKRDGLRWDVRVHRFGYNTADGGCPGDGEGRPDSQLNVTLQVGLSRFF
jgi:outer membrane beta-barrel protein